MTGALRLNRTSLQSERNTGKAYTAVDLSNSLSRLHLGLPVWGFPTLLARLAVVRVTAGGIGGGVGTSASPTQERSDPGGLDAAAPSRHSTHGTRAQPPEGRRGATEGQQEQFSS